MSDDPKKTDQEGWEALAEDAEGGSLSPSDELEAALREASDAVEHHAPGAGGKAGGSGSADKIMLEALSAELQMLKKEYETKLQEHEEAEARHVRLQAEFENFRKRGLKERQEAHHFGHQNLVKDLLSTVDNLERAIDHAAESGGGDLQNLLQGVELVHRELLSVLDKHGVTVIATDSGVFDPALHEAMAQVPDASVPPNHIVQVMQKGYQLRERMLRAARVVVSRTPESGESEGTG